MQPDIEQIAKKADSADHGSMENTEEMDEINEIEMVSQEQVLPDKKVADSETAKDGKTQDAKSEKMEWAFYKNIPHVLSNIWIVWLVIALILLIRKITIYQSFVKFLKAGCVT